MRKTVAEIVGSGRLQYDKLVDKEEMNFSHFI
jgi:hypothetical protein